MITNRTGSGRTFHHNGDYSGEVWVVMRPNEIEPLPKFAGADASVVKIPMEDLLDIVGEYVRSKRIRELEDADVSALLTGWPAGAAH